MMTQVENIRQIVKFKTKILKISLCDYSDAYILVKGTISIAPVPPPAVNTDNNNKELVFKSCNLFTDCMREIN